MKTTAENKLRAYLQIGIITTASKFIADIDHRYYLDHFLLRIHSAYRLPKTEI